MERDMDLIRELLIYFAKKPDPRPVRPEAIQLDGWDTHLIRYHCLLLFQAGFLDAEVSTAEGSGRPIGVVLAFGLTWQGHEFLAPIRDDAAWRKTKAAAQQLGSLTLETIGGLVKAVLTKKIEEMTGGSFTL